MSTQESKELARWLDHKGESTSISKEIREAIYILSPNYAPIPQLDVQDLLSKVQTGPFAEANQEAEPLALKALQDTLHSEPTPTLKIEDIFKVVSTGPLAESQAEAEIIPFHRRYRRSLVSACLAAAAALILFFPGAEQVLSVSQAPSLRTEKSMAPMLDMEESEEDNSFALAKEQLEAEANPAPQAEVVESIAAPVAVKQEQKIGRKDKGVSANKKARKPSFAKNRRGEKRERLVVEFEAEESEDVLAREALLEASGNASQEDPLDVLRNLAATFGAIPSLTEAQISIVELAEREQRLGTLLDNSDLRISFEAAYRMGTDHSNIAEIENFLRLNGGEKTLRRRLYVRLGDMYRKQGDKRKAKENYEKAIRLP